MNTPQHPVTRHPGTLSAHGLGRKMFRNTSALVVGRNLIALGRLAVVAVISRRFGTSMFGEYAIIVAWLQIAEWILDFGTTDVFVREVNREPGRRKRLVRIFLALKIFQAPLSVLVLSVGLLVMGYSHAVVRAGLVASVSLFFMAGVIMARASFKAALVMEREVLSELVSVAVMVGLLLFLAHVHAGLVAVMAAYAASRGIFLVGCLIFSHGAIEPSVAGVERSEIQWAARASFAMGLIGFVVVLHNAADLLILSKLASLQDVAIYSAAQRFTVPLMMGMGAISFSFYPVLAFVNEPERFRETCKRAMTTTFLLSGLAVSVLWSGAEFLIGIVGHQLVPGANVLRVLAVMYSIKSVSLVIGPVLFLVQAENYALAYMCISLATKVVVLSILAPRYGYMGVAYGTLAVETLVLAPATLSMVYRRTGFFLPIPDALRVALVVILVLTITPMVAQRGTFGAMVLAGALYSVLVVVTGALRISDIRTLMTRQGA